LKPLVGVLAEKCAIYTFEKDLGFLSVSLHVILSSLKTVVSILSCVFFPTKRVGSGAFWDQYYTYHIYALHQHNLNNIPQFHFLGHYKVLGCRGKVWKLVLCLSGTTFLLAT